MTILLRLNKLSFAIPLLVLTTAGTVYAQKEAKRQLERKNSSAQEVQRSYERREADGLKVTIYRREGKEFHPVNPGQSYTTGDRIKVKFQSNFDGYVYVINLTPDGERRLLFPRPLARRNNIRAGQAHDIPFSGDFSFDDKAGLEVLQILMSRSQVDFLEAVLDRGALKATHLSLDKPAQRSLQKLTGKPDRLKGSGIATQTQAKRTAGLQTRELRLESQKEGSIVILAGAKGTSRFAPGEVSIFEVRLNHY